MSEAKHTLTITISVATLRRIDRVVKAIKTNGKGASASRRSVAAAIIDNDTRLSDIEKENNIETEPSTFAELGADAFHKS